MEAVVKERPGAGNVALREIPDPQPRSGEVLIRVEAAGVCGSDLHIFHGDTLRLNLRPPVVLGHEFSGTVEATGSDVSNWRPGDRVVAETTFRSCGVCRHCRAGGYNLCLGKELIGYVHNGAFARYCLVPAHRVHGIPDRVSFAEAALSEPLAVCVHAAIELTGVQPGETAVVAGVGAVGLLCGQVVHSCGARVFVCGAKGDEQRLSVAADLGLEPLPEDKSALSEQVKEVTGGEGADLFFECAGAPEAANLGISLLRRGGRYCQVGIIGKPLQFDLEQIAYKELRLVGGIGSKWCSWRTGLSLLATGQVRTRPLAGEPLPLREWQEAFARFERKQGIKVLLRPD